MYDTETSCEFQYFIDAHNCFIAFEIFKVSIFSSLNITFKENLNTHIYISLMQDLQRFLKTNFCQSENVRNFAIDFALDLIKIFGGIRGVKSLFAQNCITDTHLSHIYFGYYITE